MPLVIDDFDVISARTPVLADLKPGGRFTAVDMYRAGGARLLTRRLLDAGLCTDTMTVTGRGLAAEKDGVQTAEPWVIDYNAFSTPERNAFFRSNPEIAFKAG